MPAAKHRRICIYCDTWSQGGIETFIAETLLHMDTSNLSFRILCAEKQSSQMDARLAEKGLQVEPLCSRSGTSALIKILSCIFPLVRFCKNESIDIVHLNVFQGVSFLQALALKLCGIKHIIVHCHGAGLRKSKGERIKYFGHKICRSLLSWTADERWAASASAGRFLFGQKAVRIIPNGIEISRFLFDPGKRAAIRGNLHAEKRLLLGCVGRIDTQKNQRFLLLILRKLKNQGVPACLLLIGDGEDEEALKIQTSKWGLEKDVVFQGTSNRISDWMCAMDALLVPSISEGLSIAAVEGQASGLPVLCSTGVPREVQLSETVQFLPLSSPEQWLTAIKALPSYDRTELNNVLRQCPYNIENSSVLIRDLYQAM